MIIKAIPKRFTGYLSIDDMNAGIFNPTSYRLIGSGVPDIITGILETLQIKNTNVKVIKPSGYFSASYVLLINQDIQISRHLVRGLFPLNIIAAEYAGNYDCLININSNKYGIAINYINENYKTSAQQGDAPEPAINAKTASQKSNPPAR